MTRITTFVLLNSALALVFGRVLKTPTAAAWLYLPLALVVALRWGLVAGLVSAIVEGTIAMAHALGVVVTAEGIETADQLSILIDLGCDYGQGFLLAEPLAADRFVTLAAQLTV